MSEHTAQNDRYKVSIYESDEPGSPLNFTFVPKGFQHERGPNGTTKRIPQFNVAVRQTRDGLSFAWSGTADDPGTARDEMEAEITARMKDRATWIDRVTSLVGQVEHWARELGWSSRRVEKNLDDARIGKHRIPGLLMQEDTCRILLEPIGRSSPGTEGLVDLYLIPAYDDIASLYYYDNRWNLHYNTFRGTNAVVPEPRENAEPLSKESLGKVLVEMRQNAA